MTCKLTGEKIVYLDCLECEDRIICKISEKNHIQHTYKMKSQQNTKQKNTSKPY